MIYIQKNEAYNYFFLFKNFRKSINSIRNYFLIDNIDKFTLSFQTKDKHLFLEFLERFSLDKIYIQNENFYKNNPIPSLYKIFKDSINWKSFSYYRVTLNDSFTNSICLSTFNGFNIPYDINKANSFELELYCPSMFSSSHYLNYFLLCSYKDNNFYYEFTNWSNPELNLSLKGKRIILNYFKVLDLIRDLNIFVNYLIQKFHKEIRNDILKTT